MRAAVLNQGQMVVRDDVAEPVPAAGQVLVEVKACGICGSDLHFARHGHKALEVGRQIEGMPSSLAGWMSWKRLCATCTCPTSSPTRWRNTSQCP